MAADTLATAAMTNSRVPTSKLGVTLFLEAGMVRFWYTVNQLTIASKLPAKHQSPYIIDGLLQEADAHYKVSAADLSPQWPWPPHCSIINAET